MKIETKQFKKDGSGKPVELEIKKEEILCQKQKKKSI